MRTRSCRGSRGCDTVSLTRGMQHDAARMSRKEARPHVWCQLQCYRQAAPGSWHAICSGGAAGARRGPYWQNVPAARDCACAALTAPTPPLLVWFASLPSPAEADCCAAPRQSSDIAQLGFSMRAQALQTVRLLNDRCQAGCEPVISLGNATLNTGATRSDMRMHKVIAVLARRRRCIHL